MKRNRRLTLLDRVVLGLSCRVTHHEHEIHIQELGKGDFDTLMQRVHNTDFSVGGISMARKDGDDCVEFKVILSHPENVEKEDRTDQLVGEVRTTDEAETLTSNDDKRSRKTVARERRSVHEEVKRDDTSPMRSETMHAGSFVEGEGSGGCGTYRAVGKGRNEEAEKEEAMRRASVQERIVMQYINAFGSPNMSHCGGSGKVIPSILKRRHTTLPRESQSHQPHDGSKTESDVAASALSSEYAPMGASASVSGVSFMVSVEILVIRQVKSCSFDMSTSIYQA